MAYDLTRLGNQEFEKLVQALTIAALGPGVGIFGSGRGGGREATFDGPVSCTTQGARWDGYGVIQAKYRERLGLPKDDAQWIINQLGHELQGWLSASDRRTPQYYIIATNVVLSPVLNVGGIDRVNSELEKWRESLGLKGFDIWHSDKINVLLNSHPEVAKKHSAWITSSDVLASIHEYMELRNDLEKQAMAVFASSFPARELINQRFVNLDQAGRADDQRIRIAQVFVDVPTADRPGQTRDSNTIVRSIIEECDQVTSIDEGGETGKKSRQPGRVVVVGGPGQGKTTISQFLCQIYRAEFVRHGNVSPEVSDELEFLDAQMSLENLPRPAARRWPIQIPLNRFADSLASGKVRGIFEFVSQRVASRTEASVEVSHCRKWLQSYPWLVVLDGLDDVPSTSNRSQLIAAIEEFLSDVHTSNSDVVIVATTRPQGYHEEFSPRYYRHFTLSPLPIETALRYGNKLIRLRLGEDLDRVELTSSRLAEASSNSATARLMESPLQVTILTLLISRTGQAPEQRFALFDEYYRVIYQRELEKEVLLLIC